MTILTFITLFESVLSSPTLLAPSTHLSSKDMQKQDGGIHPILCGEIWRRCFASLAVNATPIRNEAAKFFTSTYDNFIQTAGIRDGASYCAKVLSVLYDSLEYQIRMILKS
jgi:hypothetical protein